MNDSSAEPVHRSARLGRMWRLTIPPGRSPVLHVEAAGDELDAIDHLRRQDRLDAEEVIEDRQLDPVHEVHRVRRRHPAEDQAGDELARCERLHVRDARHVSQRGERVRARAGHRGELLARHLGLAGRGLQQRRTIEDLDLLAEGPVAEHHDDDVARAGVGQCDRLLGDVVAVGGRVDGDRARRQIDPEPALGIGDDGLRRAEDLDRSARDRLHRGAVDHGAGKRRRARPRAIDRDGQRGIQHDASVHAVHCAALERPAQFRFREARFPSRELRLDPDERTLGACCFVLSCCLSC